MPACELCTLGKMHIQYAETTIVFVILIHCNSVPIEALICFWMQNKASLLQTIGKIDDVTQVKLKEVNNLM